MHSSYKVPMQIESIERIISQEIVYNFSVEDDESYILNGVISHNCRCNAAPVSNTDEVEGPDWKSFNDWLAS